MGFNTPSPHSHQVKDCFFDSGVSNCTSVEAIYVWRSAPGSIDTRRAINTVLKKLNRDGILHESDGDLLIHGTIKGPYGTYAGTDGTYRGTDGTYAGTNGTYAGMHGTGKARNGTSEGSNGTQSATHFKLIFHPWCYISLKKPSFTLQNHTI